MLDAKGEVAVTYDCLTRFVARVEKHNKKELDALIVHLNEARHLLLDTEDEATLAVFDAILDYTDQRREDIR
jgi:hypothetical protein